jgi:hypothetical protein
VFWRNGSQIASLNWQNYDRGMQINEAMFAGSEGWILKPARLLNMGESMVSKLLFVGEIIGVSSCKSSLIVLIEGSEVFFYQYEIRRNPKTSRHICGLNSFIPVSSRNGDLKPSSANMYLRTKALITCGTVGLNGYTIRTSWLLSGTSPFLPLALTVER